MGYIVGIPCLILGFLKLYKEKKIDYLSLTWLEWGFVISLSAMKLYGMYSFSSEVYFLLAMGILFYSFSCFLGIKSRRKVVRIGRRSAYYDNLQEYDLRLWLLYIFEIVLTIFVIYVSFRTLALLSSGLKMGTIHAMYLNRGNEAFFESTLLKEIHAKFAVPMLYCNCAIAAFLIVYKRKQQLLIKIVCVFDLVIWVIMTGGRFILAYFLLDLMLAFSLGKIQISSRAKKIIKKTIKRLVILLIVIIIGYTIFRKGFSSSGNSESTLSLVFEEFYKYFSLSVPLFQHWINEVDLSGTFTFGMMFFYGILSNINWFLVKLRIGSLAILTTSTALLSEIETMVPIFRDASCNAFVTCFFYFYSDAGIAGVVLGSSIFGWLSGKIESAAIRYTNNKNVLFYLLFSQAIIKMFVRFELGNAAYIIAFIYLWLLIKRDHSDDAGQDELSLN